ncbi:MAG: hypothetical protein WC260_00360 [Candidatus Pacearchaeota archaeon]
MDIISEIKEKKEFKNLPNEIVEVVLSEFKNLDDESEIIKRSREKLRKYFGIFLTNRIVKPRNILNFDLMLKSHLSSSKRDYNLFYTKLFDFEFKGFDRVLDFGCGVNGFSYPYLQKILKNIEYICFDVSIDIIRNTNTFFDKMKLNNCTCFYKNLFDFEGTDYFFKKDKNICVFCFQILDALDGLKKNFSLDFLNHLKSFMKENDVLIISYSLESISGKNRFRTKRKKLLEFINSEFEILKNFNMYGERFLILKPKLLKT